MKIRMGDVRSGSRVAASVVCLALTAVSAQAQSGVAAFGYNGQGQLGDGTVTTRGLAGQVLNLTTVTQVAAGYHSLALSADGTVWSWGYNAAGELGDGTNIDRLTPVQVSGLTDVIQVAVGADHSLALKSDGTVWAWGANWWGQLGDGTGNTSYVPVQVVGLTNVAEVSAGSRHSVARKSDGTVYRWGAHGISEPNPLPADRLSPAQVSGLIGVTQLSAGAFHTLVRKSDGSVWGWGTNGDGELGDGTTTDRPSPVQALGLSGVERVSAGGSFSLALMDDGTVRAWGWNGAGQLGDGTGIDRHTPVTIPGFTGVTQVSAGSYHSLALKADGSAWAWGENGYGQLGNGTGTGGPIQVLRVTSAVQVSAGHYVSLVLNQKLLPWLQAAPASGSLGAIVNLTATLTSGLDNTPVSGKTIDFKIDGSSVGSASTDGTGLATLPYKISDSLTVAAHAISAQFPGDGDLETVWATAKLTVTRGSTAIAITPAFGRPGDTVPLFGKLYRTSDGTPLPGRTVTFKVDGAVVSSAVTDAGGVATINYAIPAGMALGNHSVGANFAGDTLYRAGAGSGKLSVKSETTVTPASAYGRPGDTINLTATLARSPAGTPISGVSLVFKVDGVSVGTASTNTSGVATRVFRPGETLAVGDHALTVEYAGNAYYLASSGAATLTISRAPTALAVTSVSGRPGVNVTLKARLTRTTDGKVQIGKTVRFLVDGVEVGTGVTDYTGSARFIYTVPLNSTKGAHALTAEFDGDGLYEGSSGAGTLTVL